MPLEISTQIPNKQFKSGMPQSVMLCSTFRFSYYNVSKSVFQVVQMKVFGEMFNLLFKSNPCLVFHEKMPLHLKYILNLTTFYTLHFDHPGLSHYSLT